MKREGKLKTTYLPIITSTSIAVGSLTEVEEGPTSNVVEALLEGVDHSGEGRFDCCYLGAQFNLDYGVYWRRELKVKLLGPILLQPHTVNWTPLARN